MTLHEMIYSLEMGKGKALLNKVLGVLLIVGLSVWYMVSEFHGFKEREAMDAAQVGRQIAEGRGFTTEWIRPRAIGFFEERLKNKTTSEEAKLEKFPEIYQAPLYPYVLGSLFTVSFHPYRTTLVELQNAPFRAEWVVCFFNLICTYLTAFMLLFLGARVFDGRVGFLAAVIFLVTDLVWQYAISGLSTTLLLLILTTSWFFLNEAFVAEEEEATGKIPLMLGLSGLIMGLAGLTRLSTLWILIPMGTMVGFVFRRRIWVTGVFLIAALMPVIPFLIRNYVLTQSLWGGWGIDYNTSDLGFCALKPLEGFSAIKMVGIHMLQAAGFMSQNLQGLLGGSFVAILAFASLFHLYRRERARYLQYGIFLILPFLILAGSFVNAYPKWVSVWNMVILISPLMVLSGSAFFYILLDRLDFQYPIIRKVVLGAFIFLNAIPFLLTIAPPRELPVRFPPYFPMMIMQTAIWNEKSEMMVTDMPWATAWYGDRISLWLPMKVKDLFWIHDYIQPACSMLISPITLDRKMSEIKSIEFLDYEKIITRSGIPANFPLPLMNSLPPKINEVENAYIYLSDSPRWGKQ